MALSTTQAQDQYILDSVAMFLDRNVKSAYDTEVLKFTTSLLDISKPLKIMRGKPSDSSVALSPPTIGLEDVPGASGPEPCELGTMLNWRVMAVNLYCYPAINAVDGQPSDQAADLLKAYLRNVMQTYSFNILDYSNASFSPTNLLYCAENAYTQRFTHPANRGKSSANAAERNRFDMTWVITYPVNEAIYL